MKNKKLFLTLTLILALFSFNLNVNAEEPEYKFKIDDFTKTSDYENFMSAICADGEKTCSKTCTKKETDYATWQHYCLEYGEFYVKDNGTTNGTINGLMTYLKANKCDGQSCLTYVTNKYCKNYSTGMVESNRAKVCNAIQKTIDSSETSSASCNYTFETKETGGKMKIKINILKESNKLLISTTDTSNVTEILKEDQSQKHFSTDVLHFYEKDGKFGDFATEFKKKYNENKICPTLYIKYEGKEYPEQNFGAHVWNTYFDESKMNGAYYQIAKNGGETSAKLPDSTLNLIGEKINYLDCKSLFGLNSTNKDEKEAGQKLLSIIKTIKNIIQFFVPIAILGFGTIDFSKAIFSGKEDEMKKAQSKFIKRLIIGVCVFLVPTLIHFILTIANSIWGNISSDFCGIF